MNKKSKDSIYKRRIVTAFLWLAIFIFSIYLGYDNSIKNIGFSPAQPIAFSHKKHSGEFEIKCLFCHTDAERSSFSSLPTTKSCMVCHIALKNQSELMKLVNHSFDNNIPIKYTRVNILPDYTHFNHSRHIRAQIDCSSCHGNVEQMDSVRQEKALTMQWCLDCHRSPDKFIIAARNISGILTDTANITTISIKPEDVISPSFGLWTGKLPDQKFNGFILPHKPTKGPETCSACHY